MKRFATAVRRFEKEATWLGAADGPALVSLHRMAAELDAAESISPALIGQFGLAFRDLRKREPKAEGEPDALEAALREAS